MTAVARDATMVIDFHSEVSEGVLTVYADDRQIVREAFRFARKSGLFRVERQPGGFQRERTLAGGTYTFRVYVALEGRPTKAVMVEGDLPGGSRRTLAVRIGEQGEATARFDFEPTAVVLPRRGEVVGGLTYAPLAPKLHSWLVS